MKESDIEAAMQQTGCVSATPTMTDLSDFDAAFLDDKIPMSVRECEMERRITELEIERDRLRSEKHDAVARTLILRDACGGAEARITVLEVKLANMTTAARIDGIRAYIAEGRVRELELAAFTGTSAPTDIPDPERRPDGTLKPTPKPWTAPKPDGNPRRIGG